MMKCNPCSLKKSQTVHTGSHFFHTLVRKIFVYYVHKVYFSINEFYHIYCLSSAYIQSYIVHFRTNISSLSFAFLTNFRPQTGVSNANSAHIKTAAVRIIPTTAALVLKGKSQIFSLSALFSPQKQIHIFVYALPGFLWTAGLFRISYLRSAAMHSAEFLPGFPPSWDYEP